MLFGHPTGIGPRAGASVMIRAPRIDAKFRSAGGIFVGRVGGCLRRIGLLADQAMARWLTRMASKRNHDWLVPPLAVDAARYAFDAERYWQEGVPLCLMCAGFHRLCRRERVVQQCRLARHTSGRDRG